MNLGITFAPGHNTTGMQQRPGMASQPVQEAIKLLSLRLPRIVGANAPIPQGLLFGAGGEGLPDPTGNPLLDILRRRLGDPGAIPGDPSGLPPLPPPPPRWTPGFDDEVPIGSPEPTRTVPQDPSLPPPLPPLPPPMPPDRSRGDRPVTGTAIPRRRY